ncbi:hypothetical protein OJ253_3437 [Cryptosporidium canis]|uniref:Signal peptide-containing protein n=1 Tax=Cryptosporidium canis TaxID=195482 RepID=A0A9D5HVX8_9CRYT|nr:hypothetical protein OJ253_3437 [Cryptosporidium canis]
MRTVLFWFLLTLCLFCFKGSFRNELESGTLRIEVSLLSLQTTSGISGKHQTIFGLQRVGKEFRRMGRIDPSDNGQLDKDDDLVLIEEVSCQEIESLLLLINDDFETLEHITEALTSLKSIVSCSSRLRKIQERSDSNKMANEKAFKSLLVSVGAVYNAESNFLKVVSSIEGEMKNISQTVRELGTLILECVDNVLVDFNELSYYTRVYLMLQKMIKNASGLTSHLNRVMMKHCRDDYLNSLQASILKLRSKIKRPSRPRSDRKSYMSHTISSEMKRRSK